MAVLRIHKKHQNFVILDKTCLNDKLLSWGAKGLHAYLISLPDDWRVRVSDLQARAKNGRDAVRSFLSELEQVGYIQKSLNRDNTNGRFGGLEYIVLEVPESKNKEITRETEKPFADISTPNHPEPGNPALDNPTLLNNKYNNNNTNSSTNFSCNQKLKQPITQDFYPSQETLEKAFASGYSFAADADVIQDFIDKNLSWGSEFADFNPVYLSFLAKHNEHKKQAETQKTKPRSSYDRSFTRTPSFDEALASVQANHPDALAPSESELFPASKTIYIEAQHTPHRLVVG